MVWTKNEISFSAISNFFQLHKLIMIDYHLVIYLSPYFSYDIRKESNRSIAHSACHLIYDFISSNLLCLKWFWLSCLILCLCMSNIHHSLSYSIRIEQILFHRCRSFNMHLLAMVECPIKVLEIFISES